MATEMEKIEKVIKKKEKKCEISSLQIKVLCGFSRDHSLTKGEPELSYSALLQHLRENRSHHVTGLFPLLLCLLTL